MDSLLFDREKAKESYKQKYSDILLDEKKLELMLIRSELLARNEYFIREWTELQKLKKAKAKGYQEREKEFCQKWSVDKEHLYNVRREPEPVVSGGAGVTRSGTRL